MKMVKSLILGSAAGLIAMSGAQAADLPVKAKAVEYVRICSLYGAGFFYIPGTDTCIKLGGYFASTPRSTAASTVGRLGPATSARGIASGITSRPVPVWRSRLIPAPPPNTALSAPSVRATSSSTTSATALNPNVVAAPGWRQQPSSTPLAAAMSRLKWCSSSSLVSPSVSRLRPTRRLGTVIRATTTRSCWAVMTTVTGVNNIQYTAQFGNGVSATIGLDDPTVFNRTAVYNLTRCGIAAAVPARWSNAYGGMHAPDIVGNIRVDQAWGLFQISAAGASRERFLQHR